MKRLLPLVLCLLGFAARAEDAPAPIQLPERTLSAGLHADIATSWRGQAEEVAVRALAFLGVHYQYGGNSMDAGFDCSGFVRQVVADALGINLPRDASSQAAAGLPISIAQIQPGDLVFFNTLRRTFSHVGIYLGDGRFIHAPRAGQSVRIANLSSPYWAQRFNGARRVLPNG